MEGAIWLEGENLRDSKGKLIKIEEVLGMEYKINLGDPSYLSIAVKRYDKDASFLVSFVLFVVKLAVVGISGLYIS